jgi:hypothetical protein
MSGKQEIKNKNASLVAGLAKPDQRGLACSSDASEGSPAPKVGEGGGEGKTMALAVSSPELSLPHTFYSLDRFPMVFILSISKRRTLVSRAHFNLWSARSAILGAGTYYC